MNEVILKIENLSKQYRLGLVGTGTISHDLNRWWHNVRGKEDPYLKIGDVNNRATKGTSDYVWALKDINFEVQQGEVLGIIGKNGAGKSTLLKILSKITSPTTGIIKSRGRVASLLEVGTGFHGEMTGRENIFLNGAILGMTKKEITAKLDEIIDFSGCERYIDTPVKRYSSGMTVRLAFAVAAFLEPDILIIDEVLAVGDAEFQKKAIGKMQDISKGEGRTVLFVSHNMAAVKSLCTRVLILENGFKIKEGETSLMIENYLDNTKTVMEVIYETEINSIGNDFVKVKKAKISKASNNNYISFDEKFNIEFEFWLKDLQKGSINLSLNIFNSDGILLFNTYTQVINIKDGVLSAIFSIHDNTFNTGFYSVEIMVVKNQNQIFCCFPDILKFEIVENDRKSAWFGKHSGLFRPNIVSEIYIKE
ncbi:MAG TPA: ABC transporter ATP-binding protein [Lutibacter sp.]